MCREFRGVRYLQVGVDRTQPVGIHFDPDLRLARRVGNQRVEDVLDRAGIGAADIVVRTGNGFIVTIMW